MNMRCMLVFVFLLAAEGYSQMFITVRDEHPSRAMIWRGGGASPSMYFVVGHPGSRIRISTTAPATFNSGFMMETENTKIRWYLMSGGASPDPFLIPYVRFKKGNTQCPDPTCYLPFHVVISGPGTENAPDPGYIDFTTWTDPAWSSTPAGGCCPSWDNWTYKPADVTHMCGYPNFNTCPPAGNNNSGYVVDRFWIIEAGNYTANPSFSEIKFTWLEDETMVPGNTQLDEPDFIAQRFNSAAQKWLDWIPPVIQNDGVANFLRVGPVDGANLFRSWALSDQTNPLPIVYITLDGVCSGKEVLLFYRVFSDMPVERVELMGSYDGSHFSPVIALYQMEGTYTLENSGFSFYRAVAYASGNTVLSEKTIHLACDKKEKGVDIFAINQKIIIVFRGEGEYRAMVTDNAGRQIFVKDGSCSDMETLAIDMSNLSGGQYMVLATIGNTSKYRKITVLK